MLERFLRKEDGAQIVEYALIIAVISIVLAVALQPLLIAGGINSFITRLATCLTGTCP